MKVFYYGNKIKTKESVLILGGFESIHNGHKTLFEEAKKHKKLVSVMMVENINFFFKDTQIYQPLEDRLQDMANLGVDIVVLVKMDVNIATMNGETFIKNIKESVNSKITISGPDFTAGNKRHLKAKDIKNNIIVDFLKINSSKLSTTILKEGVSLGEVKMISSLTPFGYSKTVDIDAKYKIKNNDIIKLHSGIYATWTIVNNIRYWSYLHININGEEKIYVPQLKIINKSFKAKIIFVKLVRKIIKSSLDNVIESDKLSSLKYLSLQK